MTIKAFHLRSYASLMLIVFVFAFATHPAHAATPVVHAPGDSFFNTSMRLCDIDANGTCHMQTYALSVARFGAGGAAAAGLALLTLIVFLPVRCLCGGFGGKQPSYGVCCPSTAASREYTRKEILSTKVAVFIVIIPIVIGVAIGFQSNALISSSVNTITTNLQQSGDKIVIDLQQIQQILGSISVINSSTDATATIADAVVSAQKVDDNLSNAHDNVNKYDNIRKTIMIIGFAFSLGLVFSGAVSAIFNTRTVAFIIAMVGLLVLTTIWISFGIHLVADKFVYDTCFDVKMLSSNSTNSSGSSNSTNSILATGALADLWGCGQNSDFIHLQNLVNQASGVVANNTCALRDLRCFNTTYEYPNWSCAKSPACGAATLTTVTDAQHMVIFDATGNITLTLAQCAVSCSNSQQKSDAGAIVAAVAQLQNFTALYNSAVLPLLNCEIANEAISDFKDTMCTTLFDALWGVAVSNLIVGIFYVAFIVLMIVGYKRFESLGGGIV